MPGNKCQYYNCLKTRMKFPGLSMFRFPKNKVICEIWVINSGKYLLSTIY